MRDLMYLHGVRCLCVRSHSYTGRNSLGISLKTLSIYIYMCVSVCQRERERERETFICSSKYKGALKDIMTIFVLNFFVS
jgi:hypothetical protein